MRLARGVTATYQSHSLSVVHPHPAKHLPADRGLEAEQGDTEVSPDVSNTAGWVRNSHVTLWVDVDQTDGGGAQRGGAVSLHWTGHQRLLLLTGTQQDTLTPVCVIYPTSAEP